MRHWIGIAVGWALLGEPVRGAVSPDEALLFQRPALSQLQPNPSGHWIGALTGGSQPGWVCWNLNAPTSAPRCVTGRFSEFLWGGDDSVTLVDPTSPRFGGCHLPHPEAPSVPWTLPASLRWARSLRPNPPLPDRLLLEGVDVSRRPRPIRSTPLDVFQVPASGGISEAVVRVARNPGNIVTWLADATGTLRAGLSRHGTEQRLVSFPGNRPDRATPRMRFDLRQDTARLLGIAADGSRLWFSARGGHDLRGVYELVVDGSHPPNRIASNPRYDFDGRAVIHGNTLVALVSEQDRPMTEWLDPKWTSTPPSSGFPVALLGDGRQAVFVRANTPDGGGVSVVARPDLSQASRPLQPPTAARPPRTLPSEVLRWTARDGLPLEGYLSRPEGTPKATPPLVVLVHGGPWERDYANNPPEAQFLVHRGWAVLRVNYRGSDGFGQRHQELGAGHWRHAAQDLIDATRQVLDSRIGPTGPVVICGTSFGGFLAALALTEPDSPFQAGACLNAAFDLDLWLRQSLPRESRHQRAIRRTLLRGDSRPDPQSMRVDPRDIHQPVWLGHALDDTQVLPEQSERFARSLKRLDRPLEQVLWPSGGHTLGTPEEQAHCWDQAERFLKRQVTP